MFTRTQLAEVIAELTLRKGEPKQIAREVAAYLLDTRQSASLESMLRDVMEYRVKHGVVEAIAYSAHKLDDNTNMKVREILKKIFPNAREIIITNEIDTNIIGGIKISMANNQLDLSIRGKLDNFKFHTTGIKD